MYILEIYDMIEILMSSIPENFLLEFIRNGVLDNMKKLENTPKTEIIIDSTYFKSNEDIIREKYKKLTLDFNKLKNYQDLKKNSIKTENNELPIKDEREKNKNNSIGIEKRKQTFENKGIKQLFFDKSKKLSNFADRNFKDKIQLITHKNILSNSDNPIKNKFKNNIFEENSDNSNSKEYSGNKSYSDDNEDEEIDFFEDEYDDYEKNFEEFEGEENDENNSEVNQNKENNHQKIICFEKEINIDDKNEKKLSLNLDILKNFEEKEQLMNKENKEESIDYIQIPGNIGEKDKSGIIQGDKKIEIEVKNKKIIEKDNFLLDDKVENNKKDDIESYLKNPNFKNLYKETFKHKLSINPNKLKINEIKIEDLVFLIVTNF